MREVIIVCTYKRNELLHGCLRRLRGQDGDVPIIVFSDRGEVSKDLIDTCEKFEARLIVQPRHNFHGNSYSAGEALRFAWNCDYGMVHYVEDDVFVKPDFLRWAWGVHSDFDDIFCSCGWVFNHFMPIVDETYFAPWIYIPQFSITWERLGLVLPHLNPLYYGDMWKYIGDNFTDNPINAMHPQAINHFEIDGLLQRILMQNKMQVAWNSIAKVEHLGFGGYNRGGYETYESLFEGLSTFEERVARIEEFAADPWWRLQYFDRKIVEREVGREVGQRIFRYKVTQGEWESEFVSDLLPHQLPKIINSVHRTPETVVECV